MGFPFPDDLVWVRTYVQWQPPTDQDLNDRYDLLLQARFRDPDYAGTYDQFKLHKALRIDVATQFVRARLSTFLDEPDSFSIAGEYSESNARNPAVLQGYLDALAAMSDDGGGFSVGRFVRADGDQRGGQCVEVGQPDIPRPGGYR